MAKNNVYVITNLAYRFDPTELPSVNGYLIVGEKDGMAVLSHFGEKVMPHTKAVEWYNEEKISVVRVFTDGKILRLAQLKDRLNKQPIDEVVEQLEHELLE